MKRQVFHTLRPGPLHTSLPSTHVEYILFAVASDGRQQETVLLGHMPLQVPAVVVLVAAQRARPAFPVGVSADQVALQVIHGSERGRTERAASRRHRSAGIPVTAAVEGSDVTLKGAPPGEDGPARLAQDRLGRAQVDGGEVY